MKKRAIIGVIFLMVIIQSSLVFAFVPVEQQIDENNPIERYRNSFVLDEGTIRLDKNLQNIPYTLVSDVYWGEDGSPKKIVFKDYRAKGNLGIDISSNELLISAAKEFLKKYTEFSVDVNNLEAIDVYAGSEFFSASVMLSPSPSPSPSPTVNVYPSQELATVFFKEFFIDGNGQKRYVEGSFVNIVFKKGFDGVQRIISYKANYYPKTNIILTSSSLSEQEAVESAKAHLRSLDEGYFNLKEESAGLIFYPVNNENLILAYRIIFEENDVKGYPEKYEVIIDAEFGQLLNFYNTLQYVQVTGRVSGSVYPLSMLNGQKEEVGFKDNYVWVRGDGGESKSTTDSNGNYKLERNSPIELRSKLEGPWVIVKDAVTKITSSMKRSFSEGADINWKIYDGSDNQEQSNVFYHTNLVHDFAIQPHIDAEMNFQTLARVNVAGYCQPFWLAYYDSTDGSLNFCAGTDSSLFSDVVYHEYGHSMFAKLSQKLPYKNEMGALSEALAEYTSCTLRDAQGFLVYCNYGNKYPEDYSEEHHVGGAIIVGALWDLRAKFIAKFGREEGIKMTDSLAYTALRLRPKSLNNYIEDILLTDDNNGNLDDGTPHIQEICTSATKHGLLSGTCEDVSDVPIAVLHSPQIQKPYYGGDWEGYIHDDIQDIIGTALPAFGTSLAYWTLELIDLDNFNPAPTISLRKSEAVKKEILVNDFDFSQLTIGHKYRLKLEVFSGNEPFLSSSAQITFIKSHKATITLTERKQASSTSNGIYSIYLRGNSALPREAYLFGVGSRDYSSCKEGESICIHTFNFEALSDEGDLIFNFLKKEQNNSFVARYLFLKSIHLNQT